GTWQADGKPQRVLKIEKVADGYRGSFHNLGPEAAMAPRDNSVSTITVAGKAVSFSLDKAQGSFEGALSDDGKTITGNWKMLYGPPSQTLTFARAAKDSEWVIDPSPHKTLFVTVQPGVRLEVLDWGGNGPPLIFLAGLYGTAHGFDGFAEKFIAQHHVYAITRRGFAASTTPPFTEENYDADRMGDDVLAVMAALHIEKPVLAGHSIAGSELSSVGTRHPEKIAGLVYLESLYQYAFYNPAQPDLALSRAILRRDLGRLADVEPSPAQWKALAADIQAEMAKLQIALQESTELLGPQELPVEAQKPEDLAANRIMSGVRPYGVAPVPILAIIALPRRCAPNCDKPYMQRIMAADAARAELFEKSAPNAKVIRIANASHYIYRSNQDEVVREMNIFMDELKR
ncbi:MAG TPA: alpha/beta hydrolase, partial [Rhizomicrobium sp.]|nr:alpha/beta hydrolase [Rhizomicrobium sp.]